MMNITSQAHGLTVHMSDTEAEELATRLLETVARRKAVAERLGETPSWSDGIYGTFPSKLPQGNGCVFFFICKP